MRRWLTGALCAVALLGTALLGAACGPGDADTGVPRVVLPSPSREPAAEAGGACQLLDYDVIKAQIGVDFDIAASGNQGSTYTCVLAQTTANSPDLSLAVTPSTVDTTTFKSHVAPKGSSSVSELGKVAYSVSDDAGGGAGPDLRVGWLSGNQRLITLTYGSPAGTASSALSPLLPKLVSLAKLIDLTTA